ncbi:MAG: hypothetical protein WD021_09375 [Rhodothermales bacterium]
MPQTLLALAAMMMATLFALNQQRGVMQTQMSMIRNEIETAGTGVAVDRLEEVRAMAFDEATKGGDKIFASSELTSKPTFTDDAPPIDDIDDFDASYVERFRVWQSDTLWYGVETSVGYADEAAPDMLIADPNQRTKFKKATVTVYSLSVEFVDTIRISQSFSCGSKCAW